MTIRNSNGVWFEVLGSPPLEDIGWEVEIYDRLDTDTLLARVPRWRGLKILKELSGVGYGEIIVDAEDELFDTPLPSGASGDLLAYENVWRLYHNGKLRWSWFAEELEEVEADEGERQPIKVSGRGLGKVLEEATVFPPNWPTVTPKEHTYTAKSLGHVFKDLLDEAQARGEAAVLSETFTLAADSEALAWSDTNDVTIPPGGTLLELLARFSEVADFDWQVRPDFTFEIRQTFGLHREDLVRFQPGIDTLRAGRARGRREIRNVVLVEGGDGGISVATDAESIGKWRRRATYLQAGDANSAATRGAYASAALRAGKNETVGQTLVVPASRPTRTVFEDYDVGDWIGKGDRLGDGSNDFRVVAIAVEVADEEASDEARVELTLQTRIEAAIVRMKRLIESLAKGTFSAPAAVQSSPTIVTRQEVENLTFDDLADVNLAGVSDGDLVRLDSGLWVPYTFALENHVAGVPADGQVVTWDAAQDRAEWAEPSGGGGGGGNQIISTRLTSSVLVDPIPAGETLIPGMTLTIPASGSARTVYLSFDLLTSGHGNRLKVYLDGVIEWPRGSNANMAHDSQSDVDPSVKYSAADIPLAIPGDSATHTVELRWAAMGTTAGVTIYDRAMSIEIPSAVSTTTGSLEAPGDSVPGSAHTLDDEFNDAVIDAKWSWLNQGGATIAEADGVEKMVIPANAGDSLRCRAQTTALPSGDFTMTCALAHAHRRANYNNAGVFLYNSANGRLLSWFVNQDGALQAARWSSLTAYASDIIAAIAKNLWGRNYLRIKRVSGTYSFWWSPDGYSWVQEAGTETQANYLGGLTAVGFYGNSNDSAVGELTAYWFRVTEP